MVAFSRLLDDSERTKTLGKMIAVLGTVEMIGVPVFYSLGWRKAEQTSTRLLVAMYLGVFVAKCFAVKLLSEYKDASVAHAVEKAVLSRETVPILGIKLCWPKGATLLITTIPSFCETMTVAFALGAAGSTWTKRQQAMWALSWSQTPFGLLHFVGGISLPTALGIVVAIGFVAHCAAFGFSLFIAVRDFTGGRDIKNDIGPLAWAANVAGLMMVASVLKHAVGAGREDSMFTAAMRFGVKFVLGTLLRLYFKISLLGILWNTGADPAAVQSTKFAVCLGFLHSFQIVYQCADAYFVGEWEQVREFIEKIKIRMRDPNFCCAGCCCSLFTVVPFLVCAVRFAGVLLCGTHIFNVGVWECVGDQNVSGYTNGAMTVNASLLYA